MSIERFADWSLAETSPSRMSSPLFLSPHSASFSVMGSNRTARVDSLLRGVEQPKRAPRSFAIVVMQRRGVLPASRGKGGAQGGGREGTHEQAQRAHDDEARRLLRECSPMAPFCGSAVAVVNSA